MSEFATERVGGGALLRSVAVACGLAAVVVARLAPPSGAADDTSWRIYLPISMAPTAVAATSRPTTAASQTLVTPSPAVTPTPSRTATASVTVTVTETATRPTMPPPTHTPIGPQTPRDTLLGDCTVTRFFDTWDDGTVDYSIRSYYSAVGDVLSTEIDGDGDGMYEQRRTFSYNDQGQWIELTVHSEPDGKLMRHDTFTYDGMGHLVQWYAKYTGQSADIVAYAYDRDGQLRSVATRGEGETGFDRVVRYSYDVTGRLLLSETDVDGDGSIESVDTHFWDGKWLTRIDTSAADGARSMSV